MTEAGFSNLVARAGRAFVAAKGKDPEIEGALLAEYLLSDRPLGADERTLLAEMVTGCWRKPAGRGKVFPGQRQVIEVVAALREAVDAGTPKESAKLEVAKKFGVTRGTVENYERMTIEREKIQKEGWERTISQN
jgi:hypothetical protein